MTPIRRILIANRGEIAVRIMRTCHALGVETVLATSVADRNGLPAKLAGRAICIGPAHSAKSYLCAEAIVQTALAVKADAIHPGYGFLSERASFASLCEQNKIVFIGPTSRQIEAVGDKLRARAEAIASGVPVAPGGAVSSLKEARALAKKIGAPLLIKAVGGGGGRGMKRVDNLEQLNAAMDTASAEAGAAFGDARVYLERYVSLGERDCSVQRRYQKLIEESPAPGLSEAFRAQLHSAAVKFASRLLYRGAGTVEFLVDVQRNEFYFLEMNARIQVEHPVTEQVTGIDLVAEQIAIAEGRGLRLEQQQVSTRGVAIECRVNAEDPANEFLPSPGTVSEARWPAGEGIRVDTHIAAGESVSPYYDSMMAKIIAHGANRAEALQCLRAALADTRLVGVHHNLLLHDAILADEEFQRGGVDTGYLARFMSARSVHG
jgi:acetyl-CoA carboxylase, biotin carboxylase subunit